MTTKKKLLIKIDKYQFEHDCSHCHKPQIISTDYEAEIRCKECGAFIALISERIEKGVYQDGKKKQERKTRNRNL